MSGFDIHFADDDLAPTLSASLAVARGEAVIFSPTEAEARAQERQRQRVHAELDLLLRHGRPVRLRLVVP